MEALAPSAKRSRIGEAAGQPERPAAKYASVKPLTLFAICTHNASYCYLNPLPTSMGGGGWLAAGMTGGRG